MMKELISIDLSLRAAGIVALNEYGGVTGQLLVPTAKEVHDQEYLLIYMQEQIMEFAKYHNVTSVVIEGLAFNSKSGSTDLIAGNWWNIRRAMRCEYPAATIGSIPVSTWRSKVLDLSKAGKAELEKVYGKDYLKPAVRDKVPPYVLQSFERYLDHEVAWPKKYPASKKREAIFDLCDAYWLGQHRLNIGAI